VLVNIEGIIGEIIKYMFTWPSQTLKKQKSYPILDCKSYVICSIELYKTVHRT